MNDTVMGDTVSQMPSSMAGASLRAARERAGWRVEEVAAKLKLSARQIVAIEAEDWSSLPERTFTRGFFYSYARLVNVDKSVIDTSFSRRAAAMGEMRTLPSGISEVTQENTTARPVWSRWAIPIALVACVLAGVAWILFHGTPLPQASSKLPLDQVKAAKVAAASAGSASPTSSADPAQPAPALAVSGATTAPSPQPSTSTPSLLSASTLNAANSTNLLNATGAQATGVSSAAANVPPTAAAVSPSPATAPVTTPASNIVITPGQRRIALTVNGRSWTEIRNRRETVLSETLNNTSKEISAAGPLSLVIGNASNVQLTVDGKPYDFSNYVRNDVARFSIE